MTVDNSQSFSFTKNRKALSVNKIEEPFPRWTHYLNGYEVPREPRISKVAAERLARNNVLR